MKIIFFFLFYPSFAFIDTHLSCFSNFSSTFVVQLNKTQKSEFSCKIRRPDSDHVRLDFISQSKRIFPGPQSQFQLNGKRKLFSRIAMYHAPDSDLEAYAENGRKIECYGFGNSTCSIFLNIDFSPFIETSLQRQEFQLGSSNFIECPIRAPNFPPYKYTIIWEIDNTELLSTNFTISSYSFFKKNISDCIVKCILKFKSFTFLESNISIVTFKKSDFLILSKKELNFDYSLLSIPSVFLFILFSFLAYLGGRRLGEDWTMLFRWGRVGAGADPLPPTLPPPPPPPLPLFLRPLPLLPVSSASTLGYFSVKMCDQ